MLDIRIFEPGVDTPDIYKFRYQVYEQEMHRDDSYSDHEQQIIKDRLDDFSYNIAAYKDGQVVAAVRHTFCKDGDPGFYRDFFELEKMGVDYPDKVSYTTRLMVEKKFRRSLAPMKVCAECFNLSIAEKIIWSFCDCNEPLIPFFERMFFEVQDRAKHHPSFGEVTVMRLDLRRKEIYDNKQSIVARFLR